ncbi:MAG: GTP cyclohydrolase I [Myxococcota bacterium]
MTKKNRSHRSKRARRDAAATALRRLLTDLGCDLRGEMRHTPSRAATLWSEHLLAFEGADLGKVLGRGSPSKATAPVTLLDVGVHLVCPHHLTVAFGRAHVAYLPGGRLAGFGALARLINACTARLILQEDAVTKITEALVEHAQARAAVAVIEAQHPCHNVPHARSHRARVVTWGRTGETAGCRDLSKTLRAAMHEHGS